MIKGTAMNTMLSLLLGLLGIYTAHASTIHTTNFQLEKFISIHTVNEHSGRTDKNGCHVDKKTGKKHCH